MWYINMNKKPALLKHQKLDASFLKLFGKMSLYAIILNSFPWFFSDSFIAKVDILFEMIVVWNTACEINEKSMKINEKREF